MKHIHFIGICGVGMSALAILWKKKGWKVTGSDAGFYPPVSTHLEENKIDFYPGWHPEKMGAPDLVVVGNVASSENPEWISVQKNNIPYVSYPELIARELVRKNSIVCAGTWGKTSTTALLSFILKQADMNPTYMFGGLSGSLPYAADDLGGEWSLLEGDEYKTGKENSEAKFFSYKPTHLLLTGLAWDHFDMYPTEDSYYDAFSRLLRMMPDNGIIIACKDDNNIAKIINSTKTKIIFYGKDGADYNFNNLQMDKNGIRFKISHLNNEYEIYSPLIGKYMAENICGAFAMAMEIGVPAEKIISAISEFRGIKRRLEKHGQTINSADVYDDIAHSPTKAKSVLATLRQIYTGKIFAVFEPNTGNRQPASGPSYDNCFADAAEVVIPRLTKIKINQESDSDVFDGPRLAEVITKTHNKVKLIEDDEELVRYLKTAAGPDDVVIFLGSHGFRGMIDKLLK